MLKGKEKKKGFGKGKNPPQQQTLYRKGKSGYGNDWTWNDPWTLGKVNQESIPLRNSVRGSLEMELLCFGLEVRTSTMEEPQNKGKTCRVKMFSA